MTVTGIASQHAIEACYGSRLHCHWHDVDESDHNAYRACLECGHVFGTPGELLAAWLAELGFAMPDAETVPACPYCGHDW